MEIRKGDIFLADLSPARGSEQSGVRPIVVIQNNEGNTHSTTIIAAITSSKTKKKLPTHVELYAGESGMKMDSIIMLEQIRTIDKERIKKYLGHLAHEKMRIVEDALKISLDINT